MTRRWAAGLLIVCQGHILLQKRSRWVDHPKTWGIPAGSVEPGESALEAALRETREEVSGLDGLIRAEPTDWKKDGFRTVLGRVDQRVEVSPRNGESTDVRWVPFDEVGDYRLHPGFAESWPRIMRGLPIPSVEAWRLFWLKKGRLSAPLVGDLQPIRTDQVSVCRSTLDGTPDPAHSRHETPGPGCDCGWRGADNIAAIRNALESMVNGPHGNVPCVAAYQREQPKDEDWRWPRPVLARLELIDAVSCDSWKNSPHNVLAKYHYAARGVEVVTEGLGMYRARSFRIRKAWVLDLGSEQDGYLHHGRDVEKLRRRVNAPVKYRPGDPLEQFDRIGRKHS